MPAAPPDGAVPSADRKGGPVLLVDDEADVRAVAAETLREMGYAVVEAASAAEAFDRFSREAFHLVVTDYLMPGGSGGDLIARIRESQPGFPVILVSGYVSSMENVPDGVPRLRKPFNIVELEQAVSAAIAR